MHVQYPQEKAAVLGLSQALLRLGRLDEADKVLKNSIQRNGVDAEVMSNLAAIALEKGDLERAEALYRKAYSLAPNQFITHYNLGKYLQMHGGLDEALLEFNQCLGIVPNAVDAMIAKAETLKSKGQEKESRELYIQAMQANSLNNERSIAIIKPLLAEAIEQADMDACRLYLSQLSNSIRADFRLRTIIYDLPEGLQNEFGEGASLYEPSKLVICKSFIEDFDHLEKITEQVLAHKSLINNRPGKPTRGGRQTHEIMETNSQEILALKKELKAELIRYANELPDSIKPQATSRFKISGWAVSLQSGGYQLRHSHPEAIASGVLYLSIPSDMNCNNDDKQGSLYFASGRGKPKGQSMHVQAIKGKLVMFPSYMPHETIPFESTQERICLAVNLIQTNQ